MMTIKITKWFSYLNSTEEWLDYLQYLTISNNDKNEDGIKSLSDKWNSMIFEHLPVVIIVTLILYLICRYIIFVIKIDNIQNKLINF